MSKLEQLVEQLAFGRTRPRLASCLGLYVSEDALYLAEVRMGVDKPIVSHLLRVPIAAKPGKDTKIAGTLNSETLAEADRLAELLKPAIAQSRFQSQHVAVTLSNQFGLLRYFTLPRIDRRYWKTAVPAEAKKYIPLPFENTVQDFQVLDAVANGDARRLASYFAITYKSNYDGIKALLDKVGLKLAGLEISSVSVSRLWGRLTGTPSDPSSYTYVHLEPLVARILISERGMPVFSREVPITGDPKLDQRKIDLSGCLDFCRKQLSIEPSHQIWLTSEGGPDLAVWKESFAQETNISVELKNPSQALGLKQGGWGAQAAIGASLRGLIESPLTLDLDPSNKVRDDDRRAAFSMMRLAAVISGFFMAMGLLSAVNAWMTSSKVRVLRQKTGMIAAFEGKTADQIQTMIQRMESSAGAFGGYVNRKVKLTYVLEDIADSVPNALWITDIQAQNSIGSGGGMAAQSGAALKIAGQVQGESSGMEQDTAILFKNTLQKSERFQKVFNCAGPAIQADLGAKDGQMIRDGELLQKEAGTSFNIECHVEGAP